MAGRDDERQFVEVHDGGAQLRLLGVVGKNAEFDVVLEDIVGNVAAERAPHGDLDGGMQAAILRQHGQQVEGRKFVGSDGQLAFVVHAFRPAPSGRPGGG